jgi:SapC
MVKDARSAAGRGGTTMTQMMFYERPVALNRERHRALRLAAVPNHYAFAANTNAMPITHGEFADAARDYPIVFVGSEGTPFHAAALVGLRDRQNLMVDTQGQWVAGTYVPAFARRYPFVLAEQPGSDQLTVCIDEVYAGLTESRGEVLFGGDGSETPYLKNVLEFLQLFHVEALRTTAFATRLKELGLLAPKVINVERNGERRSLNGLWMVDADKLRGIDDARVIELFRSGEMRWIEAHLLSLGNLGRLVAKLGDSSTVSDGTSAVEGPTAH